MTEPGDPTYVIPEDPANPYRLGRSVHHDPRSRAFPFDAGQVAVLGTVYWPRAVPIFDQGSVGSCTGNAAAGWLATTNALRAGVQAWGDAHGQFMVDEEFAVRLYSLATELDPFAGTYPPDDTGSDGLSVTKVLQQAGWVDTYAHAFGAPSVLAALQTGPVLVGTVWRRDMFYPDEHGLVKATGDVAGGHEYLLVGYNADRAEVTFANSWGAGWGDAGYGHMTVDTLTQLLADDGDATVPHPVVAAPVPPDPGAAGFPVDLAPDVAPHVARLAARRHITASDWVNDRLRHYFD